MVDFRRPGLICVYVAIVYSYDDIAGRQVSTYLCSNVNMFILIRTYWIESLTCEIFSLTF